MVQDLKDSRAGQWHSKIKQLSRHEEKRNINVSIEPLENLTTKEEGIKTADHHAIIATEYEPINKNEFLEYNQPISPPTVRVSMGILSGH